MSPGSLSFLPAAAAAAGLSETVPDIFTSFSRLISLDLSENYLRGTLPLLCSQVAGHPGPLCARCSVVTGLLAGPWLGPFLMD